MFNLSFDDSFTYIDYTIAVVNTNLLATFAPLANNGRLAGRMRFNRIYVIE